MFLPGWAVCWILLALHMSACGLEISGNDSDEVICSQGLSQCTMTDVMSFPIPEDKAVDVQKLTPHFRLCCKDKAWCALCLVVDAELYVHVDKETEGEGSGPDEEDSADLEHKDNSTLFCDPLHVSPVIPQVEATEIFVGFQVWDKDRWSRRLSYCPFKNQGTDVNVSIKNLIQGNVWHNVSVSVGHGQMNNYGPMLWWNLSAPCRLEGEENSQQENSCREVHGYRQQLDNGTWTQNSKGLWETKGVFEDINLQLSPCVMVNVKGMGHELGPFCFNPTDRWRWSLLLVAVMLLVCFTVLIVFIPNDFLKNCAKSCFRGGFMKIIRKGHVVLLTPPDADDGVSESVCRLGSLLCNQDFGVSVDQWSRKEQCTLGPLPWLHSQLMELDTLGGRVGLVLTQKALLRTVEWTHQDPSDSDVSQIKSPYSDVFTACLGIIQAEKQLGRAGERFLLVKFDSHPRGDRSLSELLQGLPLFQLPSQIQALLSELTVRGKGTWSGGRTWTGREWGASEAWRAKTAVRPDQQKASPYL